MHTPSHSQHQYFYSNQSRTQGFVTNWQHFISPHKTFAVKPFRCWRAGNLKRTEKKKNQSVTHFWEKHLRVFFAWLNKQGVADVRSVLVSKNRMGSEGTKGYSFKLCYLNTLPLPTDEWPVGSLRLGHGESHDGPLGVSREGGHWDSWGGPSIASG